MRLQLDDLGFIPADYPRSFFRVEDERTGKRIADFTTAAEAHKFAIVDSGKGNRDHKVAQMHMTGA